MRDIIFGIGYFVMLCIMMYVICRYDWELPN